MNSVVDYDKQDLPAGWTPAGPLLALADAPEEQEDRAPDFVNDVWILKCNDGFYWDDAHEDPTEWTCVPCVIEDCSKCSSDLICDECVEGMLLEYDQSECIEFKDCIVPTHLQPERLEVIDNKWVCTECDIGQFYFDGNDEMDPGCYSCIDFVDQNCRACGIIEGDLTCFGCTPGFVVNDQGNCESPHLPNCVKIDQRDPRKCEECLPFYSPNPSRTACVSCIDNIDYPDGALTCAVDRHNLTTKVTSCVANMKLDENGECVFEGCMEDQIELISNGLL